MEKILVTTDLSVNSKAGIRFAMELAKQRKAELIVLHVFHVLKATSWSAEKYQYYIQRTEENISQELSSFIKGVRRAPNIAKGDYKIALLHTLDTVPGIISYAKQHGCAYICISTRGAGAVKKIFGTHTSDLITHSPIPVISVPSNWRLTPVKWVLYATDLKDYAVELKKVVAFAGRLKARLEMLHLIYTDEIIPDKKLAEKSLKAEVHYPVSVNYKKINIENTILEEIDSVMEKVKPSVLVLFTHQNRSMIDRILFPSVAEEYCFSGKTPLLTFNKKD